MELRGKKKEWIEKLLSSFFTDRYDILFHPPVETSASISFESKEFFFRMEFYTLVVITVHQFFCSLSNIIWCAHGWCWRSTWVRIIVFFEHPFLVCFPPSFSLLFNKPFLAANKRWKHVIFYYLPFIERAYHQIIQAN